MNRIFIIFLALVSINGWAEAPNAINVSGSVVFSDSATPLSGEQAVRFTIYDNSGVSTEYVNNGGQLVDPTGSGASVVWTEAQTVSFSEGNYSAVLGGDSTNPLPSDAFANSTQTLGIAVADDDELSPRMSLYSVPFARRASVSDNVSGLITPSAISIKNTNGDIIPVINEEGEWLGGIDLDGIQGETGPQGPVGESGDTGLQGIQGLQGLTGEKGTKGDTGSQGIQGLTGAKGSKGDSGSQGTQGLPGLAGAKGIKGDAGSQGIRGLQGLAGAKGSKGDAGSPGTQGLQGLAGAKGTKGDAGSPGIEGLQGLAGAKGSKGDTGSQGLQGLAGAKGTKGDAGSQGTQGLPGLAGAKGSKGDTGSQGLQGLAGAKGTKGDAGSQGTQGLQGLAGVKGSKGDAGSQGTQGLPGLAGAKGDKGNTGIQGPAGDKGSSGTQGIQGLQGLTGLKGNKGVTGPQGPAGEKGDAAGFSFFGLEPKMVVNESDNRRSFPYQGMDIFSIDAEEVVLISEKGYLLSLRGGHINRANDLYFTNSYCAGSISYTLANNVRVGTVISGVYKTKYGLERQPAYISKSAELTGAYDGIIFSRVIRVNKLGSTPVCEEINVTAADLGPMLRVSSRIPSREYAPGPANFEATTGIISLLNSGWRASTKYQVVFE